MIAGDELLQIDGVTFTPDAYLHEAATRDGVLVGELKPDEPPDNRCRCERCIRLRRPAEEWWQVRKINRFGDWGSWKPARSAAEARAFICSKVWE
jgi:hypothetical protein